MPRPRSPSTLPDRDRARRTRDARKAYVAALEDMGTDAADCGVRDPRWYQRHAATIARARASRGANKED